MYQHVREVIALLGETQLIDRRTNAYSDRGDRHMKGQGLYDKELQMFREDEKEVDLFHLEFLRWLAEHGKLEQGTLGLPSGEFTMPKYQRTLV